MFKRASAIASTSAMVAIVGSVLMAGAVTAKPTRSISLDETSACHFTVEYSYSSVGGGPGLTMSIILYRQPVGTTDWWVVGATSEGTVSGSGAAILSHDFVDSGQSGPSQYFAYGYLHKDARTIRNSAVFSELTAAETCA
jgi:hypothetical protein